ncbi:hypothetical protein FOZ63_007535, partial [Perkinsus olseni]
VVDEGFDVLGMNMSAIRRDVIGGVDCRKPRRMKRARSRCLRSCPPLETEAYVGVNSQATVERIRSGRVPYVQVREFRNSMTSDVNGAVDKGLQRRQVVSRQVHIPSVSEYPGTQKTRTGSSRNGIEHPRPVVEGFHTSIGIRDLCNTIDNFQSAKAQEQIIRKSSKGVFDETSR